MPKNNAKRYSQTELNAPNYPRHPKNYHPKMQQRHGTPGVKDDV